MPRRMITLIVATGLVLMFVSSAAVAQYQVTNLVSNQVGKAKHLDPLLVNAWGLTYGPGSPFWVSDNGTGYSTLYNAAGVKQGLVVAIPAAGGSGQGSPTGIVFNGTSDFKVSGQNSFFIFATLDGTISAWSPGVNLNSAIIEATSSASYTGLAITNNASGNVLFAADQANNKVDMYDGTFRLVNSFTDPTVAAGFAPYGIQDISGLVYVTFASQSGGPGGYVDIFSEGGVFLKRLTEGSPLNQPWGLAAAPNNFGPLSNTLLVGNNLVQDSVINAFNGLTGKFVETMKDTNGKAIHIDQLWGITFGGGSAANGALNELFFNSGPTNYQAGLFGAIKFQ
jgi:uncharacterized protein (TIGR03118 family)